MAEERLIREGVVSSVNESLMTARVAFEDREGLVSSELAVVGRGSGEVQDYWLPNVGDTALCVFPSNGDESGEGWLVGTRCTEKERPVKEGGRRLVLSNGTEIEIVGADINVTVAGNLNLNVKGNVSVKGAMIYLNE